MGLGAVPRVEELLPTETWEYLSGHSDAVFIDVRTKPEWGFVGKPDLSSLGHSVHCIEWAQYPEMSVNPRFVDAVKLALADTDPSRVFFICRSGVRSLNAAKAVAAAFEEEGREVRCVNVAEGFEGDLDADKKRGA